MGGERAAALRTFLGILVGSLVALVIAEAALRASPAWWEWMGRFAIGQPPRTELVLHEARRAVEAGRDVRVVVLGSSVAAQDVDERLLDDQLGGQGSVVNLGLNASPLWNTAMLVPDALALQPEAVVLVCAPAELGSAYDPDAPRLFDPRIAWEIDGWRGLWADRAGVADRALRTASRWLRYRTELRGLLLRGDDRGGSEDPRDKAPVGPRPLADGARHVADATVDALSGFDRRSIRALRVMAAEVKDAGIPFIVAVAPIHPEAEKLAPTRRLHRRFAEEASRGGFVLVDPSVGPGAGDYTAAAFRDAVHLGHAGQRAFTEAVRRALVAQGGR